MQRPLERPKDKKLADAALELPDDLRAPLHELQADREWLVARLRTCTSDEEASLLSESIRTRLSQIEEAAYRLNARATLGGNNAEPA